MSGELSLYIHYPWCIRKCPYCDFNSHPDRQDGLKEQYLDALLTDLKEESRRAGQRPLVSIFFGGGTPSLMPSHMVAGLLEQVAGNFTLADDCEITLEANPGASEAGRFKGYREAGVNRLSLGVQSLDDEALAALGRVHSADEALAAFAMARDAGFDNINLDWMFAVPGQSQADMLRGLAELMALQSEHLSLYQLTLEPGTAFARKPPKLPDDDELADMSDVLLEKLAASPWQQYEVSAFAKPGKESRHNLNYWRFGDYIGIGAGAHGKLTDEHGVFRRRKWRSPARYVTAMSEGGVSKDERVSKEALPFEFMLNALRLKSGVDEALFSQQTGLPLAAISDVRQKLVVGGLLEPGPVLQTTALGFRHLNQVQSAFLD